MRGYKILIATTCAWLTVTACCAADKKPPFSQRHPKWAHALKPVTASAHKVNQGLLWASQKVQPYQGLLSAGASLSCMTFPAWLHR